MMKLKKALSLITGHIEELTLKKNQESPVVYKIDEPLLSLLLGLEMNPHII